MVGRRADLPFLRWAVHVCGFLNQPPKPLSPQRPKLGCFLSDLPKMETSIGVFRIQQVVTGTYFAIDVVTRRWCVKAAGVWRLQRLPPTPSSNLCPPSSNLCPIKTKPNQHTVHFPPLSKGNIKTILLGPRYRDPLQIM